MAENLVLRLIARTSAFEQGMRKARTSVKGLTTEAKVQAAQMKQLRTAATRLFGAYLGYNAILKTTRAIKDSVIVFAAFEREMANVSTMLNEQTMRYMPAYSSAVRKMAVEFGEGTDTLSKGLYDILSASIAPADALDLLAISSKAAVAGLTDTGTAADAITTVLKSYSMETSMAAKISSDLFETVQRGKLTFADVAAEIGKVSALAATAGVSLESLLATMSTLTRAGLKPEMAVTGIKNIISTFISGASPEAARVAKDLGISFDASVLKGEGLVELFDKLKDASSSQLAALMPSIRAIAAMAGAIRNAEGAARDLNYYIRTEGADLEAYAKNYNTTAKSMEKYTEGVKELKRVLGEDLAPSVSSIADSLTAMSQEGSGLREVVKSLGEIAAFWGKIAGPKETISGALNASELTITLDKIMEKQKAIRSLMVDVNKEIISEQKSNYAEAVKTGGLSGFSLGNGNPILRERSDELKKYTSALQEAVAMEENLRYQLGLPAINEAVSRSDLGVGSQKYGASRLRKEIKVFQGQLQGGQSEVANYAEHLADEWQRNNPSVNMFPPLTKGEIADRKAAYDVLANATNAAYSSMYGGMDKTTQRSYEVQKKIIDSKTRDFISKNIEEVDAEAWKTDQMAQLEIKRLLGSNKAEDGITAYALQSARDRGTAAKQAYDAAEAAYKTPDQLAADEASAASKRATAMQSMYNQMDKMSTASYNVKKGLIDKTRADNLKLNIDMNIVDMWYNEQKIKLDIERYRTSGELAGGFRAAHMQMGRDLQNLSEQSYDVAMSLRDSMRQGLTDSMNDWDNWGDHAKNTLRSVLLAMQQSMVVKPTADAASMFLTKFATSMFMKSASGGGLGANDGGGTDWGSGSGNAFDYGGEMHTGGLVGRDGTPRMVPSGTFNNAKRYHGGLRTNEFPAILEEGEQVTPKGGGSPEIYVTMNNSGTPQKIDNQQVTMESGKLMLAMWTSDFMNEGDTFNAVKHKKGLN